MKSIFFSVVITLTFFFQNVISAQVSNVCVIDVATVFKNHAGFNEKLQILKNETEQFAAYLQSKVIELQAMAERLKTLDVNSPGYAQLERELAQANASLQVERSEKTRKIQQREAQIHFETYVQTTQAVANLCSQRGIRLVLQYSAIPMSLENPESIMQRVNSDIVYHKPHKDITQDIIAMLNTTSSDERMSTVPGVNR